MENVLRKDDTLTWVVVGNSGDSLEKWRTSLPAGARERVTLTGKIPPSLLAERMRRSKVLYCPSAFESFHIASGEALCAGCSVVGPDLPGMSSFQWFCGEGCGTLARDDSAEGHVKAVRAELAAWAGGHRDPVRIGRLWGQRLHAPAVAARILELRDATRGKGTGT
jgi:glycosyltransferase involved in cell wall biosynthesis